MLDKLFESIIAFDKSINVDDIIIGDKNAIALTRILGYGPEYKIKVPTIDGKRRIINWFIKSKNKRSWFR